MDREQPGTEHDYQAAVSISPRDAAPRVGHAGPAMPAAVRPRVSLARSAPWGRAASPLDRELLFADFQPLVRRLVRQYGGDDAELRQDLSGEIYFRFCALLEAYDPERGVPLRPYLVRQLTASVYTYARQQWRSRKREVSLEGRLQESGEVLSPGPAAADGRAPGEWASDPTSAWDEAIVRGELLCRLPHLIEKLPPRQRQVLVWRYYEERTFEEIAGRLQVKVATTRSLLRHGLNTLRRELRLDAQAEESAEARAAAVP